MLRRGLFTLAVGLAGLFAFASSASAAATLSVGLVSGNVHVGWSTTGGTPTQLQLIWTYVSGPASVSSPVTLTLASTATSGSLTFDPLSVTSNASFSAASAPIVNGTWSVVLADTSGGVTADSMAYQLTIHDQTDPPVLTAPAASGAANTVPVDLSLPDTPTPGSVDLVFTNLATSATTALTLADATTQSFALDPANLLADVGTTGVQSASATSLPDGRYDVTLSYQDSQGDPPANVTVHGWTLDTVTQAPTLSPPSGGVGGTDLGIQYDLPEAPLAGSATLTFSGPATVTLGLAPSSGAQAFQLDPAALAAAGPVTSISPPASTLPPGTYTATLSYRDALGNPAQSAVQGGIVVSAAPPAPPSASAPAPTPPPATGAPTTAGAGAPAAFALLDAHRTGARGAIAVDLALPGAGAVGVTATISGARRKLTFGRATATAAGGHLALVLHPTKAGRRLLARRRHLKVQLLVRFTPPGGDASTARATVRVRAPRR